MPLLQWTGHSTTALSAVAVVLWTWTWTQTYVSPTQRITQKGTQNSSPHEPPNFDDLLLLLYLICLNLAEKHHY